MKKAKGDVTVSLLFGIYREEYNMNILKQEIIETG